MSTKAKRLLTTPTIYSPMLIEQLNLIVAMKGIMAEDSDGRYHKLPYHQVVSYYNKISKEEYDKANLKHEEVKFTEGEVVYLEVLDIREDDHFHTGITDKRRVKSKIYEFIRCNKIFLEKLQNQDVLFGDEVSVDEICDALEKEDLINEFMSWENKLNEKREKDHDFEWQQRSDL